MFGLLRKFGWLGGLVALARTPIGRQLTNKAVAFAKDPATRRKAVELRTKVLPSNAK